MSTSDAGELERRVGGGERATPPCGTTLSARTATAREQRDETLVERQSRRHEETPAELQRHRPGIRWEETHRALRRTDALKKDECLHGGDSELQTRRTHEPRFTSSLFLRLSSRIRHRRVVDSGLQSVTKPQPSEGKDGRVQVNGGALSSHTSLERTSVHSSLDILPRDGPLSQAPGKEKDSSLPYRIPNGDLRTQEHHSLHACISLPGTNTGSVTGAEPGEDIKEHKQLESRADLERLSAHHSPSMLSSTVVTVLAPPWTGRIRRPKKPDSGSDAQGNLQDPSANRAHGFQETFQYGGEGTSDGGSQMRRPLMAPRNNTVGWSTKADPSMGDSRRKLMQTVSLDVNAMKTDTGDVSPLTTHPSPASPFLLNQIEQGRNLQANQAQLSALSSKPTTSSLLLSLRRCNSSGKSSNTAAATLSNASTSPTKQNEKLFSTQGFLNKNEPERPKPLLSPGSLSYGTTETGPVRPPSSANQREINKSDTPFFSTTPISRESDNTTMNKTQSTQAFLSKGQPHYKASDKSANLLSATSVSVPRHPSYDHSPHQKPPSVPRATLTSTSWWKQVTRDGNAPFTRSNPTNIEDKPNNIPLTPPHDTRGLGSMSPTDNKRFTQIRNNGDNNNTTEAVFRSNMKPQGGTADLRQRNTENSPNQESGWLVMQQHGSNLNNRALQTTYSVPCVSFTSKMSRASSLTMLSHLKDSNQHDASNGSAELPPPLRSPRSPSTPTGNNNHRSSKSNSPPASHMDSQPFIRSSPSPDCTLTTSGLSTASNAKSPFSFYTAPSQSNIQYSSSQTPKLTDKVTTTPLGFERNYASIPKPFQSKTVSSLMPTVPSFSKTNYNYTPPTSGTSSSTTTGHPVATSPSLLSPSITPSRTPSPTLPTSISSLLTPPATPNTTNATSTKGIKTFSSSLERDPKKKRPEAKRARRVTWDQSVDLHCSESAKVEKQETSPVPAIPLSPSRPRRDTPSIFSFLRSGSPECSPDSPHISSTQPGKGKYRSLSSDAVDSASREREKSKQRIGDATIFDQEKQVLTTPMQERTQSVESGSAQCRSSAPLSLPPDFSRNYKLRYSSPPYSTLRSSRPAQGETKPITPRSPLFPQPTQSQYGPSSKSDKTLPSTKPSLSPTKAFQLMPLPFPKKTSTTDSSKCDQVINNHDRNIVQAPPNSQLQLVNNRVNYGSESVQVDRPSHSSFVTETLIYSIKHKADPAPAAEKSTTPKPLQHTANTPVSVETKLSQHSHSGQSREAAAEPRGHSDQSSSGSSSTDSQSQGSRRMKDGVLGKSRFFSIDVKNEQSPKKSRFALKKSVSTPNANLARSESERVSKTSNKVDQVLNKLRQRFSTKRQDDDPSFPWKWRRGSQTPSISSDVSNLSDNSVESTKTVEEKELVCHGSVKNTDDIWTQNRYTIIPSSTVERTGSRDHFSGWSEKSTLRTDPQEPNACPEDTSESKVQLRVHSPPPPHFDFYQDNSTDYNTTNQLVPCRDPSPCQSPNTSGVYPIQFRKSTPSPRSPFSPFASLSPVSHFPAPDPADDNVFYSPKLQRRELGDTMSHGATRKASTGPPSISPGQDKERLASSYADLKYGIEPGKSFSVSSVLSSRPSGPGRISTGSRFMSVGDLSHSALSYGGNGGSLDPWSAPPEGASDSGGQAAKPHHLWYLASDPGKFRSRSLPRSLTKCLANWSSEGAPAQPSTDTLISKPARLHNPSVDICHFTWEAEGPPTPPPTPPMSLVTRRISKPPSLPSPTFPSTSGALQADRAQLRSGGYMSSLSTFEESSDSSSDTTTDDEYYLEADETGEKETEL